MAWLQAASATAAARTGAGRIKVGLELGVAESERPSEEGRSKSVLQYNRPAQKKSMKPMPGVYRVFLLPTVLPATFNLVHS